MLSTNQLTKTQIEMPTYWVQDKRAYGLGQQCPSEGDPRPDFGWGGAAGAYYFVDRTNNIAEFLSALKNTVRVRVLPYHNYAASKYTALNIKNTLPPCIPTESEIKKAESTISSYGLK